MHRTHGNLANDMAQEIVTISGDFLDMSEANDSQSLYGREIV